MIDRVTDAVMGQGNTRWFKTRTPRSKAKAEEGPGVQLLHVHLPVVVVSGDGEGMKTQALSVHGGPGSGKCEQVMYDNRVGVQRGAIWLQPAIRIGGGSAPPAAVRDMDLRIAEYVGRKEKRMLRSCTHVKAEESYGDQEQLEQRLKRPKKEVVKRKCKGKGKIAAFASGSQDIDALVDRLTDAVSMPLMRHASWL